MSTTRDRPFDDTVAAVRDALVVIRGTGAGTVVEMINPQTLVEVTDNPDMRSIAQEVSKKLASAMERLRGTA